MKFKSEYKSNYFRKRINNNNSELSETPTFPKNALIEVSNACNHACVFCSNSTMLRSVGTLDLDLFEKFIKEAVKNNLQEVGLYSTGEPLITKNLDKYIMIAKKNGVQRVYITTNGSLATLEKIKLLKNSGLDSLKFSINAATEDTYKIIHGKNDFKKVINNVKQIYDWKNNNNIKLQMLATFVYTKLTEKELPLFKEEYAKYFEDVWYLASTGQAGDNIENTKSLSPFWTYDENIKPCQMVFNRLHLTYEGFLTACCSDYENNLTFADLNKEKFNLYEEWNNSLIQNLRLKHLDQNLDNLLCKSCRTGDKYEYEAIIDLRGSKSKSTNNKSNDYNNRIKLHNELV